MVQGLQGTIAFTPILMIRRNIIRQRNREYYTVARRYEFYVRVARTISHE